MNQYKAPRDKLVRVVTAQRSKKFKSFRHAHCCSALQLFAAPDHPAQVCILNCCRVINNLLNLNSEDNPPVRKEPAHVPATCFPGREQLPCLVPPSFRLTPTPESLPLPPPGRGRLPPCPSVHHAAVQPAAARQQHRVHLPLPPEHPACVRGGLLLHEPRVRGHFPGEGGREGVHGEGVAR